MIPYISLRVDLHSCVEDPEDFIDWLRMRLVYSLNPQTESDIEVFLPGRYTHQPPRRPYVEALPDPRETTEVWSWGHTRLQDRNGGWYRYERVSPRSYRPW